jgi:hypothetical protein
MCILSNLSDTVFSVSGSIAARPYCRDHERVGGPSITLHLALVPNSESAAGKKARAQLATAQVTARVKTARSR